MMDSQVSQQGTMSAAEARQRETQRLLRMYNDIGMKSIPLFSIYPGKRKAVVLTQQRSGSTLLVALFALIDNSFVLPEPHNMFDVNTALPSTMVEESLSNLSRIAFNESSCSASKEKIFVSAVAAHLRT